MWQVLVVGDALLDVHVAPHDEIRPAADVPAAIRIGPGGQGANIAVRLARRGVAVALVCSLADDVAGRMLRSALHADGVKLVAIPAAATGTVVIVGDDRGERTMMSQRAPFAAEAVAAIGADAAWLMVSGYLLLETGAESLARAVAARPGRRVLVGCAVPDGSVEAWRSAAATLRPDILIVNRNEVGSLAIDHIGRVVTHAGGADASIGAADAVVAAPAGSAAVDTTGAGDAFAAALVDGLRAAPWPPVASALESALRDAVMLAGAVARTRGAQALVAGERGATLPP